MGWPTGWLSLTFAAAVVCMAFAPPAAATSDNASLIIARGDDGFVVTQQDAEELGHFIQENTPFETTPEALRRYAVRVFLFAKEARRQGLPLPESFQPLAPVHTELALAEAYLEATLRDYALDPIVIESYYRAHFDDYVLKPQTLESKKVIPEDALIPLESEKASIRKTLLGLVRQRVAEETFHRLMETFHVSGEFSHAR